MDIKKHMKVARPDTCKNELIKFLDKYINPAFGTLTKKEIDLMVFEMLENLNYLNALNGDTLFNDQQKLKITSTKTKNMFYELELRRRDEAYLNDKIKQILKKPLILKDGNVFKLVVHNPLVMDHIKNKIAILGHVTDGSFSKEIVTLTEDAYYALIQDALLSQNDTKKKQQEYIKNLIKAGATDKSIIGITKSIVKNLASKVLGKAAEKALDGLLEDNMKDIESYFDKAFKKEVA